MLIKKQSYPERSDLAICTVTKIQFNSIFVSLDEYDKKQGIIHISEISPGRIRNIRDYVKEGKVIVCVVLRVSTERDLIELSLRRVAESQRRQKISEMKQEQKAEKIIEFVARSQKMDEKALLTQVIDKISKDYDSLHVFFEDVIAGQNTLETLGLPKKLSDVLQETIEQRIKPAEVIIKGRFLLRSFQPDGIGIIKTALKKGIEHGGDKLNVLYMGAGKYDVTITAEDYKSAEKVLDKVVSDVSTYMDKHKSECTFSRTDK
jgi:translation initiation factor 2 subunit 1